MTPPIGIDELRTLFLFEGLTDDQLHWLADRMEIRTYDTGSVVVRAGEPADALFVLIDGAIQLRRPEGGEELVVNETSQRGVYMGAVRAYSQSVADTYLTTVVATQPSRLLRLPADDFATFVRTELPMAVHLLDGLYTGTRTSTAMIHQREHLARLGTLSANLAHELNNPAAAAVRATGQLRTRVAGMRHKLGLIADAGLEPQLIGKLIACQASRPWSPPSSNTPMSIRPRARTSMCMPGSTAPSSCSGTSWAASTCAATMTATFRP